MRQLKIYDETVTAQVVPHHIKNIGARDGGRFVARKISTAIKIIRGNGYSFILSKAAFKAYRAIGIIQNN